MICFPLPDLVPRDMIEEIPPIHVDSLDRDLVAPIGRHQLRETRSLRLGANYCTDVPLKLASLPNVGGDDHETGFVVVLHTIYTPNH